MRRLIGLVVLAAALWGGYWFVAARGLEAGLRAWLEGTGGTGWQVSCDKLAVRGFPNRLDTTLDNVLVEGDGFFWQAPFLQIMALSYRPNHVIVVWPHEQRLNTLLGDYAIASADMRGSAVFRPSTSLALDHSGFVIKALTARSGNADVLTAQNARFATRLAPDRVDAHRIGAEVTGLAPSAALLARLSPDGRLPALIERLKIDATLSFDRPLDRFALEQPLTITGIGLEQALLEWGDIGLDASGELSVGHGGLLDGTLRLGVTNWRRVLALSVESGALDPDTAAQLARGLEALARGGDDLDLPLSVREGRVSMGPIPLGTLPPLRLN